MILRGVISFMFIVTSIYCEQRWYSSRHGGPYRPYRRHQHVDRQRDSYRHESYPHERHQESPRNTHAYRNRDDDKHMPMGKMMENDCMDMMHKDGMDGKMSSSAMKDSCRQYAEWCMASARGPYWQEDDGMMKWFNGLTTMKHGGDERHYHRYSPHHRRYSRQTTGRVRREIRTLSDDERQRFIQAVLALKRNGGYDVFVRQHHPSSARSAHFGPGFAGWHREMLIRFENALRQIDPTVVLPYLASSLDNNVGNQHRFSVLWSDEFLGNPSGAVTSGPFRNFRTPNGAVINRNVGAGGRMMSDGDIATVLNAPSLESISWFINPAFEISHGSVHNFVSGTMANLTISPADPVFFLHHAFVDCLFEEVRQRQVARGVDVQYNYPNSSRALGVGMLGPDGRRIDNPEASFHHALNEMSPFNKRNIDGLSNEYAEIYSCAPRPTCSRADTSCGGPYLFCDETTYRCLPVLTSGASCARYEAYSPCYNGVCCDGTCQETCGTDTDEGNNVQQPLPQQPEPVPQQPEPVPQQPEPVPQRPEPVPQQPRPVPQQPQPVPQVPVPDPPAPEEQPRRPDNNIRLPQAHPGVPTHPPFTAPTHAPLPTHPPNLFG